MTAATIHPINYLDDALDAIEHLPGAIQELLRTDHETIGRRIKTTVKITAAALVLAVLVTLDITKLVYQAGYALGQAVHKLNHDLTLFLCGWGLGLPPIQPLAPQVNPWQLQLPIVTPALQRYVSGSTSTTTSSKMVENQPLSTSTQLYSAMADQRKAAGTLNVVSPSEECVSSARSKQSVQHSSLTSGRSRSSKKSTTGTATRRTGSASKTSTVTTTRRSGRITSKKPEV